MVPGLEGQISSAAAKALEQQAQAPAGPGKAAEGDVAKFEQLMSPDGAGGQPGTEAVKPQENAQQANVIDPNRPTQPGDAPATDNQVSAVAKPDGGGAVDGLARASEEINAARQEIVSRLSKSQDLSPKELLDMQFKLAQLTMQQTMIGKAGEKSEQAVQQLFRG